MRISAAVLYTIPRITAANIHFSYEIAKQKTHFSHETKVKNYTFPKKGSYSSPSTLQQSNPISLALSGPKVK